MPSDIVYPALKEGKRVALFFVDAFRYEMGKCFADSMMRNEPEQVKIGAKLSFLPSVTRFGMAAHLGHVKVVEQNGKLQPSVDGRVIITPDDRLDYLKQKTHVVTQDVRLENFDMSAIEDNVQLLVIRSQDMDTAGEEIKLSGLAVMEYPSPDHHNRGSR